MAGAPIENRLRALFDASLALNSELSLGTLLQRLVETAGSLPFGRVANGIFRAQLTSSVPAIQPASEPEACAGVACKWSCPPGCPPEGESIAFAGTF